MNHRQASNALYAVLLVTLLSVSGIALPYPIFAPLFGADSHYSIAQFAGVNKNILFAAVLAAYPLGMFIGSSLIGSLSDSFGRRKTLLLSSVLSAFSYLLSAVAIVQEAYLLLLLSRLITGLCEGNIAIGRAILTDISEHIDKTKAFSLLFAVSYMGWLLGPLIGGYSANFGFEHAFYIASGLTFASLLAIYLFIPETNLKVQTTPRVETILSLARQNNSFHLLRRKAIRHFFVMYLLLTTGLMIFYQYFPLWLSSTFSYTSQTLAHVTVTQTIAMIAVSTLLVTQLKNRLGKMPTIYLGVISLSLLLFLSPQINADGIYFYFFATGGTIAIYNGLVPVYASDRFSDVPQGKLMGLLTSTYCLSGVIAAVSAGLISTYSITQSIQFGGGLLLLALLILVLIERRVTINDKNSIAY
ncbi:MAG: MFS transporter [Aestuariibacter sp.]